MRADDTGNCTSRGSECDCHYTEFYLMMTPRPRTEIWVYLNLAMFKIVSFCCSMVVEEQCTTRGCRFVYALRPAG